MGFLIILLFVVGLIVNPLLTLVATVVLVPVWIVAKAFGAVPLWVWIVVILITVLIVMQN